jgi:hypothetical protein
MFLWSLKKADPVTDALVRGTEPGVRIRTKMSRIANTGQVSDSDFVEQCFLSGSAFFYGSYGAGMRIRITQCGSVPVSSFHPYPVFISMRIRIKLFTSMRIRILLLIEVMQICDRGSTDPSGLLFEPPRLYFEGQRASTAPFLASKKVPEF